MTGVSSGAKKFSPSAARNEEPIVAVLMEHLPSRGRALEVASGTGQHAAAFAKAFPEWELVPSDPSPVSRESIAAWAGSAGVSNVAIPRDIDVMRDGWHGSVPGPFDAVLAINLLHISPWAATVGLVEGAARLLTDTGLLYVYGAFKRGGKHVSESNAAFDWSLRREDPEWGVRDVDDVAHEARRVGLDVAETIAMPANNFSLIIKRRPGVAMTVGKS